MRVTFAAYLTGIYHQYEGYEGEPQAVPQSETSIEFESNSITGRIVAGNRRHGLKPQYDGQPKPAGVWLRLLEYRYGESPFFDPTRRPTPPQRPKFPQHIKVDETFVEPSVNF